MSITSSGYINLPMLNVPQTNGYRLKKCGTLITPDNEEIVADTFKIPLEDGVLLTISKELLLLCVFKAMTTDIKTWCELEYKDRRYQKKHCRFPNAGKITCSKDVRHFYLTNVGRSSDVTVDGVVYRRIPATHFYGMSESGVIMDLRTGRILEPVLGRLGGTEVSVQSAITRGNGRLSTAQAYEQTWGEWNWRNNYQPVDEDKPVDWNNFTTVRYDGPIGCHKGKVAYAFSAKDYFTGEEFHYNEVGSAAFNTRIQQELGLTSFGLNTRLKTTRLAGNCLIASLQHGIELPVLKELKVTNKQVELLGRFELVDETGSTMFSARSRATLCKILNCNYTGLNNLCARLNYTVRFRLGNLTLDENKEIVELDGYYKDAFIWRRRSVTTFNIFTGEERTFSSLTDLVEHTEDDRETVEAVLGCRSTMVSGEGYIYYYTSDHMAGKYKVRPSTINLIMAGKGEIIDYHPNGKIYRRGSVMQNKRYNVKSGISFYRNLLTKPLDHQTFIRFGENYWMAAGDNHLLTTNELMKKFNAHHIVRRLRDAAIADKALNA